MPPTGAANAAAALVAAGRAAETPHPRSGHGEACPRHVAGMPTRHPISPLRSNVAERRLTRTLADARNSSIHRSSSSINGISGSTSHIRARLQPPVAATATSTAASPAVAAAGRAAAPPPHPPTANPSLIPTCPRPADDPAARALAAALWSVDRLLGWAATAAAVTAVVATMAGLAADPRAAAIAAAAAGGGGGGGGTPALGADTPRWGGGGRRPTPPPRPGVVGGGSGGCNRGSSRGRRTPANHTIGSHGHRRCCRRHRPRRR